MTTEIPCCEFTYSCPNCSHNILFRITSPNNVITTGEKRKKEKKTKNFIEIPMFDNLIMESRDLPIQVKVCHNAFWITDRNGVHTNTLDKSCDRNSVLLSNYCLLYVYKLALRHLLLSMRVITPSDIDAANLVPHIVVRKNKLDPFSKYDSIQNRSFVIREEDLSVKSDFLLIELDEKQDLHFTLIYSKKINKRVDLIKAFKTVIKVLNAYPHLVHKYEALAYFGENEVDYWYNTPNSFPFDISPLKDYKPNSTVNKTEYNVTPGGSIIEH